MHNKYCLLQNFTAVILYECMELSFPCAASFTRNNSSASQCKISIHKTLNFRVFLSLQVTFEALCRRCLDSFVNWKYKLTQLIPPY